MKRAIFILSLLLALSVGTVGAQQATEPPVIVDGGGGGVDTIIVQPPIDTTPEPVNTGALLNLVAAILIGVAGGGTVLIVFDRIISSREVLDNTERAYESLSPQWQETIRSSVEMTQKATAIFERALQFADKATDKLPNDAQSSRALLTIDQIEASVIDLGYTVAKLGDGRMIFSPPPAPTPLGDGNG